MARILIIDDEEDVRWILTTVLQGAGYEVTSVGDGKKGLMEIDVSPPDVVLCDLRMPGIDGLEVLRRIKDSSSKIPIIMLTGYGSTESAVQSMKMGAFDYMAKPFSNEKLLELVRDALAFKDIERKDGGIIHQQLVEKLKPEKSKAEREEEEPAPLMSLEEVFEKVEEPKEEEKAPVLPVLKEEKKEGEKEKKQALPLRSVWFIILGIMIIFGGVIMQKLFRSDKVFTAPSSNIAAFIWAGKYFWASDWFIQNVYKLELNESFSVVDTYHTSKIRPSSLAWDGKNLWTCDGWAKKIYKHNMDEMMTVLETYDTPSISPSGITWDGRTLWSCDSLGRVYKHRMDGNLSVEATYEIPSNAVGIVVDQDNVWTAHSDSNRIYQYSMKDGFRVVAIHVPSIYLTSQNSISGITWDGRTFWTVSEGSHKIFKHNFLRMKIKKIFGK